MENKETETKVKPALHVANQLLKKSFAGLILGSIFLAVAATAQTTAIEGAVRGPDGKALKGADVRLESKTKGALAQTTKTDTSGRYQFSKLSVGKYRITVLSGSQVQGFIDNVNTSTSKARKVDFDIKGRVAGQPKKAKHLVWVPNGTGTHIGGRWVEVDDGGNAEPDALNVKKVSGQELERAAHTADAPGHP
jgi:hypothetical protein